MPGATDHLALPRSREGDLPCVVQVWGDGALFTRPEFKAERVTYPAITPSAAIGVLEAIFWKPEFRYRIVAVEILAPIMTFSIRRNETTDIAPLADAVRGVRRVDTAAHRDQRHAICLRDVAYRIHAHIEPGPSATKPIAAYREQLRRRVRRGSCFQQPYLGTREFSAEFGSPDSRPREQLSQDIGIMLHSIRYERDGSRRMEWFDARIDQGVMYIPERGLEAESEHGGRS